MMRLVSDFDICVSIGDYYFHENETHITIRYGTKFGHVVTLPINSKNRWTWNGDKKKPTLQPSILVKTNSPEEYPNENVHFFVRDGRIVPA